LPYPVLLFCSCLLAVPWELGLPQESQAVLGRGWGQEVATGAWGENLQEPVGYSWGGGTAGTQQRGVGRVSWDGSQPVQRSCHTRPWFRTLGTCRALDAAPCPPLCPQLRQLWWQPGEAVAERSPSRYGCSSWMASQCYLLLPLDGEISNKGKQRKFCCVPLRPPSL